MKFITLILLSALLSAGNCWGQAAPAPEEGAGGDDIVANTQTDMLTVAGAGVGGAILGLSTLSFYEKPSKHLTNIWTGGALGLIAGVIVVAINHAEKTQEEMAYQYRNTPDFSTKSRETWHAQNAQINSFSQTTISSSLWSARF